VSLEVTLEAEAGLLRRLQVPTMLGGLLDDPALLAAAASDVGLDSRALGAWCASDEVERALQADIDAAQARAKLSRVARPLPAGADFSWTAE
jgi:hypothetical protein